MTTWQRDSHGLYDYESTNTDKTQLKTRTPGYITRKATQGEQSVVSYEESPLSAIAQIKAGGNPGEYQLCKMEDNDDENSLIWNVIQRRAETVEEMGDINSSRHE